ncbi:hypothetical protein Tco_0926074 [Tanacetum coccineum]|uniref:Uncharacterized protein n=1 Tax=Tanacetum coccineum TaxID=301880 RepID=A0ABQ5D8P9_9ASTR
MAFLCQHERQLSAIRDTDSFSEQNGFSLVPMSCKSGSIQEEIKIVPLQEKGLDLMLAPRSDQCVACRRHRVQLSPRVMTVVLHVFSTLHIGWTISSTNLFFLTHRVSEEQVLGNLLLINHWLMKPEDSETEEKPGCRNLDLGPSEVAGTVFDKSDLTPQVTQLCVQNRFNWGEAGDWFFLSRINARTMTLSSSTSMRLLGWEELVLPF